MSDEKVLERKRVEIIQKGVKQREILQRILKEGVNDTGDSEGMTKEEYFLREQVRKAMDGDQKAAEFVRDLSGNKPREEIDLSGKVTLEEALKKVVSEDEF